MPELVKPSEKYKESFFAAMVELQADNRHYDELKVTRENFADYLKDLADRSQGVNVPADRVPATGFWLVEGDKFIGRLDIRHELNDNLRAIGGHIGYFIRPSERRRGYGKKILELGLREAKKLGLKNVLVTCDITNLGSAKIIQENGGRLENQVEQGEGLPAKARYWIEIE